MAQLRPTRDDEREFYQAYGAAMANWAGLEYELGNLFISLTGLPERMGRAIFFSARSFLGRADMITECIPFVRTVPDGKRYLVDLVKLARKWAETRNALAHDMHGMIMQEGRKNPTYAITPSEGAIIEKKDLAIICENFFTLSQLVQYSRGRVKRLPEPELCRAALALLPKNVREDVGAHHLVSPLLSRIARADE